MVPEDSISRNPLRVVLIGFMGAGKSTVGPILAERMGWTFLDADHYLQEKTGRTIAELFSLHGEPAFRKMEAEVFAELHQKHNVVFALGGGAMETESIRALLAQASEETRVVFLEAPFAILIDRCEKQTDGAIRPILKQRDTLAHRFAARLKYYEAAHITITTEGLTPDLVADQIMSRLLNHRQALELVSNG